MSKIITTTLLNITLISVIVTLSEYIIKVGKQEEAAVYDRK
jgi:hypothetical protein